MNTVEVSLSGVPAPSWRNDVARFCRRTLAAAGIDGWELSVLLCSDAIIRGLNARYRVMDRSTDVLSFSQLEGRRVTGAGRQGIAGDLVISVDTLHRNAAERGIGEREELTRLVVHGILHLAGMDHGPGRGRTMRDRERRLLATLADEEVATVRGGEP